MCYNTLMDYRHLVISGQVPAQKNSKKVAYNKSTGKPFIMTEARVKEWQSLAKKEVSQIEPLEGAVEIEMVFYNKDARKRDLDNMMTSVLDVLKNTKIIDDDNCLVARRISGEFGGIDKENPRMECTIIRLDQLEL